MLWSLFHKSWCLEVSCHLGQFDESITAKMHSGNEIFQLFRIAIDVHQSYVLALLFFQQQLGQSYHAFRYMLKLNAALLVCCFCDRMFLICDICMLSSSLLQ